MSSKKLEGQKSLIYTFKLFMDLRKYQQRWGAARGNFKIYASLFFSRITWAALTPRVLSHVVSFIQERKDSKFLLRAHIRSWMLYLHYYQSFSHFLATNERGFPSTAATCVAAIIFTRNMCRKCVVRMTLPLWACNSKKSCRSGR